MKVRFVFDRVPYGEFHDIFQRGFMIEVRLGGSIGDLLRRQLGIPADIVAERIQTVFLDGSPVDDLEGTGVSDGNVLSLSAAMPGLAGAALRKKSHLAPLRGSISASASGRPGVGGAGKIRLKLFNLLMDEIGPALLERGITVDGEEFADFVTGRSAAFWEACREIIVDGATVGIKGLRRVSRASSGGPVGVSAVSRAHPGGEEE